MEEKRERGRGRGRGRGERGREREGEGEVEGVHGGRERERQREGGVRERGAAEVRDGGFELLLVLVVTIQLFSQRHSTFEVFFYYCQYFAFSCHGKVMEKEAGKKPHHGRGRSEVLSRHRHLL